MLREAGSQADKAVVFREDLQFIQYEVRETLNVRVSDNKKLMLNEVSGVRYEQDLVRNEDYENKE